MTVLYHPTAVWIGTILIVTVGQASEMPENDHVYIHVGGFLAGAEC